MILDKLLQCWQRKLSHCELRIQLLECFCGSDLSLQLLGNVPLHRGFAGLSIHMQCLHHVCTMVPACFNSIDMTGEVLNWGMIIAASMRSTLQASMETNEVGMLTGTWKVGCIFLWCRAMKWDWEDSQLEVIFLSMDNLWRSTQSLYVTLPLHFYSFTKATEVGGDFWMSFFLPNVAWIIDWPSTHFDFCQAIMTQNSVPKRIAKFGRYFVFQLFESSILGSMGFPQPTANLLNTWWRGLLALPFLWCRCDLWAPLRIELLSRDEVLRFVGRGCFVPATQQDVHWFIGLL